MRIVGRRRRVPSTIGLPLVMILVVGACSGGDSSAVTTGAATRQVGETGAPAATAPTDATFAPATTAVPASDAVEREAELGDGAVVPIALQPAAIGRDIIFRAELTVAVTDVAAAGDQATAVIQSLGGFIFGQRTTGGAQPRSVLTFKVRPEDFQEALDRLGSIGEIRNQTVTADDVTERVVDLESRIITAEASVARLRGFLEEAGDIETIAKLERQLLNRETTLETLRGQLRTLQGQVALATIVLTLTEASAAPNADLALSAYAGTGDDGAACPGDTGLTVDQGDDVTLCFEIINIGDTPLTGFTLSDPVLDIELDDLIVVFGDPAATLEPGQSLILSMETSLDRDLRTRTRLEATPVDPEGNPITARQVVETSSMVVGAVDPGGIPSFTDGLSASWGFLVDVGKVVVVIAGWLVPFLWVPVLIGLYLWLQRRRRPAVPMPHSESADS